MLFEINNIFHICSFCMSRMVKKWTQIWWCHGSLRFFKIQICLFNFVIGVIGIFILPLTRPLLSNFLLLFSVTLTSIANDVPTSAFQQEHKIRIRCDVFYTRRSNRQLPGFFKASVFFTESFFLFFHHGCWNLFMQKLNCKIEFFPYQ